MNDIDKPFIWRDQDGKRWPIDKMRTKHLFYTIRMIWNHSMPEEAKLLPYRKYNFSAFYTSEYMQRAVESMIPVLAQRRDLPLWAKDQLQHMVNYSVRLNEQSTLTAERHRSIPVRK